MKMVNLDNTQTMIREPCIKVDVAGYYMTLQHGDDVTVESYPCELCGSHTNVRVYRKGLNPNKKDETTLVFERES
jgi:hypothetical protein